MIEGAPRRLWDDHGPPPPGATLKRTPLDCTLIHGLPRSFFVGSIVLYLVRRIIYCPKMKYVGGSAWEAESVFVGEIPACRYCMGHYHGGVVSIACLLLVWALFVFVICLCYFLPSSTQINGRCVEHVCGSAGM